ncbi:MAG: FAD-dependent oxidoreductase, partial [Myxococcota bacterium]
MKPISDLPFVPVDIESVAISELVAHCRIDHAVAPVPHTRGGSTEGYARWEGFKARGIRGYGRTRNDPLRDGVSRMSAYLHYGHVSPMRLARESKALKADKYLDELVTWRELAYTYCYYESDLDTADALPSWARETLKAAERDPRPALLSWESLARAQTGDALWDACQRSLLVHGELHNNVRMTWGKAFLKWTPNVSRALELCLDLNHRYALDGRDPSSYGGILWCFGQLDRPFSPAQPILGVVRPRPTEQHAKRLDVRAYAAKTGRPLIHKPPRVAIVGAGMAGMSCARTLADHGVPVTVFDKGRGPGGRMSTRRAEPHVFDHGAQYFVARDP